MPAISHDVVPEDEIKTVHLVLGSKERADIPLGASVHAPVSYAFRWRAALRMSAIEVACEMVPS